jgi:hypothetical protein
MHIIIVKIVKRGHNYAMIPFQLPGDEETGAA